MTTTRRTGYLTWLRSDYELSESFLLYTHWLFSKCQAPVTGIINTPQYVDNWNVFTQYVCYFPSFKHVIIPLITTSRRTRVRQLSRTGCRHSIARRLAVAAFFGTGEQTTRWKLSDLETLRKWLTHAGAVSFVTDFPLACGFCVRYFLWFLDSFKQRVRSYEEIFQFGENGPAVWILLI